MLGVELDLAALLVCAESAFLVLSVGEASERIVNLGALDGGCVVG